MKTRGEKMRIERMWKPDKKTGKLLPRDVRIYEFKEICFRDIMKEKNKGWDIQFDYDNREVLIGS